jgi:hypothetical protein
VDEFTRDARRFHGGYTRLLDAYVFNTFDLGEGRRANVRFGRHVVSWGEGAVLPRHLAGPGPGGRHQDRCARHRDQGPAAARGPGLVLLEVSPRWSILGHAQFNFHPTLAAAPGSYLNSSDGVGPGGSCLGPWAPSCRRCRRPSPNGFDGCSFGNRGDDILPGKTGQWGLGTRFRVTDETEVGLYYLNYHDRTPLPEINAFTPGTVTPAFFNVPGNQIGNGSYRVRYFDDVKLLGATVEHDLQSSSPWPANSPTRMARPCW